MSKAFKITSTFTQHQTIHTEGSHINVNNVEKHLFKFHTLFNVTEFIVIDFTNVRNVEKTLRIIQTLLNIARFIVMRDHTNVWTVAKIFNSILSHFHIEFILEKIHMNVKKEAKLLIDVHFWILTSLAFPLN